MNYLRKKESKYSTSLEMDVRQSCWVDFVHHSIAIVVVVEDIISENRG